eukprot:141266-Pelagomonas_calceolata.AAC.3
MATFYAKASCCNKLLISDASRLKATDAYSGAVTHDHIGANHPPQQAPHLRHIHSCVRGILAVAAARHCTQELVLFIDATLDLQVSGNKTQPA